jgi:acylphosphatase
MPSACFRISGRVQGVYFRGATRETAQSLGLCGQAINLADGSVEVIASGSSEALAKLESWLQHGPPAARVTAVIRTDSDEIPGPGFRIG